MQPFQLGQLIMTFKMLGFFILYYPYVSRCVTSIRQLVFAGIKGECLHYISSCSQKLGVKLPYCKDRETHAERELVREFPVVT